MKNRHYPALTRIKEEFAQSELLLEVSSMRIMSRFKALSAEDRPQGPSLDGKGLRFETMDHGGEYDDAMPQAIKLTDREGRSCIYVPMAQDGRVVDTRTFACDEIERASKNAPESE